MSLRWLFRVDVASERATGDKETTRGLGHAMKCIALARTVLASGGEVRFSIEGDVDVGSLFEAEELSYELNGDHIGVVESFDPDVVVTDINYLGRAKLERFRKHATVVNIAPRGESKYYADLSFTMDRIVDTPEPPDSAVIEWYSGPEYAILNPEFVDCRRRLEASADPPQGEGVIVQMGGVDKFDMTGDVLRALDPDRFTDTPLTVVAGPYNPHVSELRTRAERFETATLVVDPEEYASLVAEHELGLFGTGISTYEALAVGVPSINVGHSSFHDMRGERLAERDLGVYLGRHDEIDPSELATWLGRLLDDGDTFERMRTAGYDLVDGQGTERIVTTVRAHV